MEDDASNPRSVLKQKLKGLLERERSVWLKKEELFKTQVADLLHKLAVSEQTTNETQKELKRCKDLVSQLQEKITHLESSIDDQSYRHQVTVKTLQQENHLLLDRISSLKISSPLNSKTIVPRSTSRPKKRATSAPRSRSTSKSHCHDIPFLTKKSQDFKSYMSSTHSCPGLERLMKKPKSKLPIPKIDTSPHRSRRQVSQETLKQIVQSVTKGFDNDDIYKTSTHKQDITSPILVQSDHVKKFGEETVQSKKTVPLIPYEAGSTAACYGKFKKEDHSFDFDDSF
ncbi:hypothetical protein RCL1_001627 [Eukaryota sp. TZLM3-RCL]